MRNHGPCYCCDSLELSRPDHNKCMGKCAALPEWHTLSVDPHKCSRPCPCLCNTPLSRNEVMEVRDYLERLRR